MSSESKIKVMIVDDHAIVREGIAEVLEQSGEFEVVGQAGDGEQAVELAQELRPDVIIMDIVMPFKDGIAACRDITAVLPDTRVLMLTASNRDSAIVQAVNAGATGYLQKFSGKEMLLSTLREIAAGEFSLQGEAARRLVTGMGGAPGPVPSRRSGQVDGPRARSAQDVCPGYVVRGDSRSAGQQESQDRT